MLVFNDFNSYRQTDGYTYVCCYKWSFRQNSALDNCFRGGGTRVSSLGRSHQISFKEFPFRFCFLLINVFGLHFCEQAPQSASLLGYQMSLYSGNTFIFVQTIFHIHVHTPYILGSLIFFLLSPFHNVNRRSRKTKQHNQQVTVAPIASARMAQYGYMPACTKSNPFHTTPLSRLNEK